MTLDISRGMSRGVQALVFQALNYIVGVEEVGNFEASDLLLYFRCDQACLGKKCLTEVEEHPGKGTVLGAFEVVR